MSRSRSAPGNERVAVGQDEFLGKNETESNRRSTRQRLPGADKHPIDRETGRHFLAELAECVEYEIYDLAFGLRFAVLNRVLWVEIGGHLTSFAWSLRDVSTIAKLWPEYCLF